MNLQKTELVVVLDRSGSMSNIKNDMEGGLKTFFEEQKSELGTCFVSVYQFDTEYELVFENQDITTIPNIKLNPRGSTALLDAIGKTINSVGERLSKTPEDDRPGLVIINVITDGQENASKEFTKDKIKEMVQHQIEKYNWQFIFLGANQDAILNGVSYGFSENTSLTYNASMAGVTGSLGALLSGVSGMRLQFLSGEKINYSFSSAERSASVL